MMGIANLSFLLLLICYLQQSTNADNEVRPNPPEHIEGVTFEKLGEVFQSYPVEQKNTNQTCDVLSGHREVRDTNAGSVSQRLSKPCYSALQNCRYDKHMQDKVRLCVSANPHRRYDFMIANNEKLRYGRGADRKCESSTFEIYSNNEESYPCVCECESIENQLDRYFSLLDVVSDDDQVVTGVRFRKVDHVFYIQIQQGRLGPERSIDGDVSWKDVISVPQFDLLSSKVSKYYKRPGSNDNSLKFLKNNLVYALTNNQRTVLLDDLKANETEVVTGLRFQQVDNDLTLEIQVTPFVMETGEMNRKASRWVRNEMDKNTRREMKAKHHLLPNQYEYMYAASSANQFIKFRVSDFTSDLGQTTVPYVDTSDVTLDQPRALTGAGIFHVSSGASAGFIALKTFVP